MEVNLLNILDFIFFRKEFKNTMNIGFFKYLKLYLVDNYIFFTKDINGNILLFKTEKIKDDEFLISDIYEAFDLGVSFKETDKFKDNKFICDSSLNNDMISKINIGEKSIDEVMYLNLENFEFNKTKHNFNFEKLARGNEEIRCDIQNDAFKDNKRMPVKIRDIRYEMSRECFIPDLAYFIKYDDIYIGYGQILYLDSKYTVVNLCIKQNFQAKGIGRILLKFLLNQAKKLNIEDVFIKVKSDNYNAKKLYTDMGFEILETTTLFKI